MDCLQQTACLVVHSCKWCLSHQVPTLLLSDAALAVNRAGPSPLARVDNFRLRVWVRRLDSSLTKAPRDLRARRVQSDVSAHRSIGASEIHRVLQKVEAASVEKLKQDIKVIREDCYRSL